MKFKQTLLALALVAGCGQVLASGPAYWPGHLPPLGEGRLVGTWHLNVTLAPCAGGASHSFLSLNTYHAGGTLTSTDNTPPPGNGPSQGIWEYKGHGKYQSHMQFYTFGANGLNSGLADIYQDITLNWSGMSYTSVIDARILAPAGVKVAELCGTSQATRVPMDSNP